MSRLLDDRQCHSATAFSKAEAPVVVPVDAGVIGHQSRTYWDWRSAFNRDPYATPFQHPDVVLAELATTHMRSRLKAVVVRDDSDRNQSAFGILLPKTIRSSQVGGVGPEWTLHGLRLVGGRILGDNRSQEQQQRILQSAAKHAAESNVDFLLIEDLDESTLLHRAVYNQTTNGCLLFVTHDFQPRHYVDLPASETDYLASFSSHCRKLFRRALKKCANSRLERITSLDQIPYFLQTAHEISRQSWQSHQLGIRIRNDEAELQQLTTLAMHGMLRSYLFWIDGKPAAFAVGNQNAGCFRYEETGFCSAFRHFSPGRTMLQQIIVDLIRHDSAQSFDFGFGDAEYKQQFANRESRSGTVWLVPPSMRARIALSHLNVCRMLRSAVYTRIKQSGFGIRARQWIRSHCATSPTTTESETHSEESRN